MSEKIVPVTQRTRLLHAAEQVVEAVRDACERNVTASSVGEDPEAIAFSGSYIGRAIVAFLHQGKLGAGSGRLYVATSPKQAYPYAQKWITDTAARIEAVRYTAEQLREIGLTEQEVEQYLMDPTVFAFGSSVLPKLVTTNAERGYLATRPGEHVTLQELTRAAREEQRRQYGVDFVEVLEQSK